MVFSEYPVRPAILTPDNKKPPALGAHRRAVIAGFCLVELRRRHALCVVMMVAVMVQAR